MPNYDRIYKLLFADAHMVRDLLLGFVHEDWVHQIDFATLKKQDAHFVDGKLKQRMADVIWKVRLNDQWLHIFLLLEFQSRADRYMASRIGGYVHHLHQSLIQSKQLEPGGLLPPVFPIVLHNGPRRWRHPTQLSELLAPAPAGLQAYQPEQRFLLIDTHAYTDLALRQKNLAEALICLENSRNINDLEAVLKCLLEWMADESPELETAFTHVVEVVMEQLTPHSAEPPRLTDLKGAHAMLHQTAKRWTREWKAEGLHEGLLQGRMEGEANVLQRLLQRKFGVLPDWVGERLATADQALLEAWTDAVLDADTLAKVFDCTGN